MKPTHIAVTSHSAPGIGFCACHRPTAHSRSGWIAHPAFPTAVDRLCIASNIASDYLFVGNDPLLLCRFATHQLRLFCALGHCHANYNCYHVLYPRSGSLGMDSPIRAWAVTCLDLVIRVFFDLYLLVISIVCLNCAPAQWGIGALADLKKKKVGVGLIRLPCSGSF